MLQQENLSPAIRGGQLVASTPSADSASEGAEKTAPVAEYNGKRYQTFDEALVVAKNTNGAIIKLLADVETAGLNLNNDLTIDGNGMP